MRGLEFSGTRADFGVEGFGEAAKLLLAGGGFVGHDLELLAGADLIGHLVGDDCDAVILSTFATDGRIDKCKVRVLELAGASAIESDESFAADVGLARAHNFTRQRVETLALEFRERFENWLVTNVTVADHFAVGLVCDGVDDLGSG